LIGLNFLPKLDRLAIHAAIQLEKLVGVTDPVGVSDLLKWFSFTVGGTPFAGKMTQKQAEYLRGYEAASQEEFANAVDRLLGYLNKAAMPALIDLNKGLSAVAVATVTQTTNGATDGGVIDPPVTGRCKYDTDQCVDGVTENACNIFFQSTDWTEGVPCPAAGMPVDGSVKRKEARPKTRRATQK
jgi:hypothetical protein